MASGLATVTTDLVVPEAFHDLFWFLTKDTPDYRYYDYPGGRNSGKSTTVATALAMEGSLHPIRVLCTREYQNSIAESVQRLLLNVIARYNIPGYEHTNDSITNANGTTFIFKGLHDNPESTVKGFEDIDRCWVEEAQFITNRSLDVLLPTIRKPNSTVIFTRNPLTPEDAVTRRFVTEPEQLTRERTISRHTTYRDMEAAGILNDEVRLQVEEARDTPEFAHIWEGLPFEKTLNQIISWNSLIAATHREPDTTGTVAFGVDVARYGKDRTAVSIRRGLHLETIRWWRNASITESAQRIRMLAEEWEPTAINVDDTGIGGGLTDTLKDMGLPVVPINFGGKPKATNLYPQVSSELWFDFSKLLPTVTINPDLEERTELFQELSTREWQINTRNQREVQRKKDYKTMEGTGSPDLADSVLLCYYTPRTPAKMQWGNGIY